MTTLVLTVSGQDRDGLVSDLATTITQAGGNWERSHIAEAAGRFAGLVVITAAPEKVEGLRAAVQASPAIVDVAVQDGEQAAPAGEELHVEIVGNDHPGIISAITATLARHQANIVEMASEVVDAPMAGGRIFEALVTASVPASADPQALEADLERLAGELQVDVHMGGEE